MSSAEVDFEKWHLEPVGESAMPPRIAQRGPPEWYEAPGMPRHGEEDPAMPGDPLAQLEPEFDYDPRATGWRPAEVLRDRSLPLVRKPPPPLPLPTAKTISNTPRKTGCGGPITLLCSAGA